MLTPKLEGLSATVTSHETVVAWNSMRSFFNGALAGSARGFRTHISSAGGGATLHLVSTLMTCAARCMYARDSGSILYTVFSISIRRVRMLT